MVPDPCNMPALFWTARDALYIFSYYVLPPVHFLAGLFGHLVSYVAFRKESRNNVGYVYQTMLMGAETVKIFIGTVFIATFRWWSGYTTPGPLWYTTNYYFMWYSAHIAAPLSNMIAVSVVLLTVAMAADRLFAISKPHLYVKTRHQKFYWSAFVISIFLGIATSLFDFFVFIQFLMGRFIESNKTMNK